MFIITNLLMSPQYHEWRPSTILITTIPPMSQGHYKLQSQCLRQAHHTPPGYAGSSGLVVAHNPVAMVSPKIAKRIFDLDFD